MIRSILVTTAAFAMMSSASADVLQEKNISSSMALTVAQAAVAACAADGYNVAASVVDRAGVVRALLRADNAGPHTVSAATQKAYTSASARVPTSMMADNVQKNPAAAQLTAIDGFLVLAGGVPIKIGNETIGAIGVGGAPGGHLDEACANVAITKISSLLK
jgi:uncharacterized protein GlcG (DUF336 family)